MQKKFLVILGQANSVLLMAAGKVVSTHIESYYNQIAHVVYQTLQMDYSSFDKFGDFYYIIINHMQTLEDIFIESLRLAADPQERSFSDQTNETLRARLDAIFDVKSDNTKHEMRGIMDVARSCVHPILSKFCYDTLVNALIAGRIDAQHWLKDDDIIAIYNYYHEQVTMVKTHKEAYINDEYLNHIENLQKDLDVIKSLITAFPMTGKEVPPILQYACEQTEVLIAIINEKLNEESTPAQIRSQEEFIDLLRASATPPEISPSTIAPYLKGFEDALNISIDCWFLPQLRIRYGQTSNRFAWMVMRQQHLAEAVVVTFADLAKILSAFDGTAVPDMHQEIIAGITETIAIKVESLHESLAAFMSEVEQLLDDFSQEQINIAFDDDTRETIRKGWFTPDSLPHHEAHEKRITGYLMRLEKAILRFNREVLTPEICTYEEILTHSVSLLRESQQESVQNIVCMLDDVYRSIDELLLKKGIIRIHPAPQDAFNGREHEVLMAEQQEGFSKGEIIKTMTSGYKQGDQVLIRANIIAAR